MLPIVLTPLRIRIGAAGEGEAFAKRVRMLEEAGFSGARIFGGREPTEEDLESLDVLFVAGWDESRSRALYAAASKLGLLVNVEDVPKLCDFHVPAQVRRGDLLITVSTGGRSPGLSAQVREMLEELFGAEWEERMNEVAVARARWRSSGLEPGEVAERTRELVREKSWLDGGDTR